MTNERDICASSSDDLQRFGATAKTSGQLPVQKDRPHGIVRDQPAHSDGSDGFLVEQFQRTRAQARRLGKRRERAERLLHLAVDE